MRTVRIKNLEFGAGKPKICVPLVARNRAELRAQAESLAGRTFDLVEWRADWYGTLAKDGSAAEGLRCLRECLGERPLLFTIRTQAEGGQAELDPEVYVRKNKEALAAGADLIDVELALGAGVTGALTADARASGAASVLSSHDFSGTPPVGELERRLRHMQEAGCDIAKLAVMPKSAADVLTLLAVTEHMRRELSCPLITMAMAGQGVISRLCGEVFGSCLTFGAAEETSAPGQVDTEELASVLDLIHRALTPESD